MGTYDVYWSFIYNAPKAERLHFAVTAASEKQAASYAARVINNHLAFISVKKRQKQ